MRDPKTPENQYQDERRQVDRRPGDRPPFDTSDLGNIPQATDDDPPYRSWWVVDNPIR
jgi:hypothetical protein